MSIPLQSSASMADYRRSNLCTWCDGCGDYAIWTAAKRALVELGVAPHDALLCFDVGCHGNMSDKLGGYRAHGLHGRVIPFAAGAKLANRRVTVLAFGGDGASFSEGVNHLVHAIRSNYPLTFILHNNANYGLTTGQASAVTWQEQKMNASPYGIPERTLNSMDFLFSLQPTFIARATTTNLKQLTEILTAAIRHQAHGFAIVDVLQACPTYNPFATHEWLLQHCYDAAAEGHDIHDFGRARQLACDTSERVATGILYQNTNIPSFYERLEARKGVATETVDEVVKRSVDEFVKELV